MIIVVNNNVKKLGKNTKLIIKLLQELNIKFKVVSHDDNIIDKSNIKGIILSGSSLNLTEPIKYQLISNNIVVMLKCKKIPILGICFGFQIMCMSYGGKIKHMNHFKHGIENTNIVHKSKLFKGLPEKFEVCSFHGDKITCVPSAFDILCTADDKTIHGIQNTKLKRYGLQFHPERNEHTKIIIKNFLDICKVKN